MAIIEDDDDESFGDFTFASSIPKTNGSDLPFNNNDDDDWDDFVKSGAHSRSESLPAKSFGSYKSFDPFSFCVGQNNKDGGSSAAGLLFNGATEVKTNNKKLGSDLTVSDLISNLYKQREGANGSKPDSKESGLILGNLSSHGLTSEYTGLDLKRSVSNLESNGMDLKVGVLNLGSNGLDLRRSVSTLDSNGSNWGLNGWEFNVKSENAPPIFKAENGPISNLNGFNSSLNVFGSDLNGLSSNLNGNLDANKSILLVNESEDFGDDDGWEFKVAESGTLTGDSDIKVNGKGLGSPGGVKHAIGFGYSAALPTDLFVASDGISQKSPELNFGDFSKSSVTPNGINSNSFSDSKQKDDCKNGLTATRVNGNVDKGENFWEFKVAYSESGLKNKGNEVKENHKGALPLSFFCDGEQETDDPLIYQDASTSNPAPSIRDSTKKSPGSNISINDLISSLYCQAEQNTSVNHMQSPSENHLDSDGDIDDDSWEFKDAFSRTIYENQTSTAAEGDSHKKNSTKVEQKDYADFYSELKDELCVVAQCHLDNLKKARSAAAICGKDYKVKALDMEIQDLSNELLQDRIISNEPHLENHPTSNICLDEFIEVLQEPKFHAFESEYHLSKRLSLAEKDWRSAIELLKHVASMSKILTLGSKDEQCNYVSTWFKLVSVCAQELRYGASIWKLSLEKNLHSQILSDPRGKQYILALGEIYRAAEVLGSSAKFYKPWLLLSYADPAGIFTLLSECSNLWSISGLEEAFQSISDPIGFEYNVTPTELLESVKYIHDLDAVALHNQVFSGKEPTCQLSLLPAGTVPGMKMELWNGEHYFLTLANLWGNLISIDPPNLPHMFVG